MKQIALLSHVKGTAYLQDMINEWIVEANNNNWEILNIFMPSAGILAIIYEVTNPEEIEQLKQKGK